ncbi:MAG: hypothetical protein ISS23_01655 [Nanoarchaeota archaeon]|nr:hypothetical protein [Nanoarchaeota archaeon]
MGFIKKACITLLAVYMVYGGIQMSKRPKYYGMVLKETGKLTLDAVINKSPKITDEELYIDTHMHIRKPSNYQNGIEEIVETAMEKVDVIMIMTHSRGNSNQFDYKTFTQAIEENPKYEIKDYGVYATVESEDGKLIAIKSQELGSNYGRDILAIGCDRLIEPNQDIQKIIKQIHEQSGIAIIAHPMSIKRKAFIPFSLANEKQIKDLEIVYNHADAIEQFNSQNYLWLCRSNVLSELFTSEKKFPGTAGSDTHGDLEQIGLSGIIIKKNLLNMDNLIEDLRIAIKNKNFRTHKEYPDPIKFYKIMVVPFIKKLIN